MATAAMYFLMLVTHPGESPSLTKVQNFQSQAACQRAAAAVSAAIGPSPGVEFGCVSAASIDSLRQGN